VARVNRECARRSSNAWFWLGAARTSAAGPTATIACFADLDNTVTGGGAET
jgi:hypothetical protein